MSKYLNVPNGNYKIKTQVGGTIFLDTGPQDGNVEISGNLIVQGDTTTINTAELTIEDRVIELNRGDNEGVGIQGVDSFSGIRINRGTLPHAFFGYDEDVGGFIAYDQNSNLLSLRTNEITTGGQTLLLNADSGTVRVNSTVDYEEKVFTYSGGSITGYDIANADIIPNAQAVVDYVAFNFANVFLRQIGDGTTTPSSVEVDDFETTGNDSVITFNIDSVNTGNVYDDRWEFHEVKITGKTIETISGNDDLVLKSSGTGSIRIDDTLHLNRVPSDGDPSVEPPNPLDGTKIYVADESTGKSGIFFANDQDSRDELVSKNRALLFGMLF